MAGAQDSSRNTAIAGNKPQNNLEYPEFFEPSKWVRIIYSSDNQVHFFVQWFDEFVDLLSFTVVPFLYFINTRYVKGYSPSLVELHVTSLNILEFSFLFPWSVQEIFTFTRTESFVYSCNLSIVLILITKSNIEDIHVNIKDSVPIHIHIIFQIRWRYVIIPTSRCAGLRCAAYERFAFAWDALRASYLHYKIF